MLTNCRSVCFSAYQLQGYVFWCLLTAGPCVLVPTNCRPTCLGAYQLRAHVFWCLPTAGPYVWVLTNCRPMCFGAYQLQAHMFGCLPTAGPRVWVLTSCRPMCLGANFTSVTEVRLSTRLVRFSQWFCPASFSHTAAVRSNEQVANTCPNSGWAHVTRHTEPLCVWLDKPKINILLQFLVLQNSSHPSASAIINSCKNWLLYQFTYKHYSVSVRVTCFFL